MSIITLEHQQIPQNLKLMKAAGIHWVRTDFSCWALKKKDGTWDFSMPDHLLDEADKYGINILPILEHPAKEMVPVIDHMDQWCEYVRQTVTHYKSRLRCWEVWNEHNASRELGESPKPEYYVELLKRTSQIIREIDSSLIVVYGGLAGCPHDYFEKTLQLGAGRWFDIMNIHPYREGLRSLAMTQKFVDDIKKFDLLMKKYDLSDRPIWITEMGWPTPQLFLPCEMFLADAAITRLFPDGMKGKAAFFYDPLYENCQQFIDGSADGLIPPGCVSEPVDQNKLSHLDPKEYPILFLPPSQDCLEPVYDSIYQYVKKGGTLYLCGGIPFYYGTRTEDNHVYRDTTRYCRTKYIQPLGISWYAWWTRKDIPKETPVELTDAAKAAPRLLNDKIVQLARKRFAQVKGMRFLDDSALRENDQFIPLLKAKSDNFEGVVAGIYKLDNKEVKGNVIVNTLINHAHNNATVQQQAIYCPQSILTAFSAGVEKYFWYEFISEERDPGEREDHFGIVHADLSPKPIYFAWQTLTSVRPDGSKQLAAEFQDNWHMVSWKRPDGKTGWAIWSPAKKNRVKCVIQGKIERACNYLGEPVEISPQISSLELTDEILYLIGPEQIDITP